MESSLSLEITQSDIQILQQVPQGNPARSNNPLYLPPRAIEKNEFKTKKLDQLIDTMYSVMLKKAGVGIAANQIGKQLQVFIIEAKSDNPRYKVLGPVPKQVFINPRITKVSDQRKNFWHGCLSAEGKERGNVATYEWIEYECFDESGNLKKGKLDGFAAVIFQHEFRHLMTGTYLDVANHFLSKTELDHEIEIGRLPFFETASDTLPLLIGGYITGQTINEYHTKK
jgi:peptide deformylase